MVRTVAVMGGSGDDRFDDVRASGADVYVTADLRHHPVLEAREEARGGRPYLVDAGHWATESLWLASGRERLLSALEPRSAGATRVETRVSALRTEPWTFVVGANAARADRRLPNRRCVLKADPSRQWRLLDLQAIDTRLDQIAHATATPAADARRRGGPARARRARDGDRQRPHGGRRRPARADEVRTRTSSSSATGPPATRPGSTPVRAPPRTSRRSSTS